MIIRPRSILSFACLLALAVAGPAATAEDLENAPRRVFVTASSHCDWAWGHPRAWHEDRYAETIRQVLLLMRENRRYVWQLENENEELAPFLKKAATAWPGMADEFWQRVREGRIEVIGAISNPRLSEVYPETLVRNLVLGKQYFQRHAPGLQQPVFNAVDVMCGSSQMPQILSQAGYRYFMFSRPHARKTVFWRTGLDGTRMPSVLQHYSHEGIEVRALTLQSHSGDDVLPSAELAAQATRWDPNTRLLATSAAYFEELQRRGGPVRELSGVLDSLECSASEGSIHGNRNLYALNNQTDDRLVSAEKAVAMASMAGTRGGEDFGALWHDLLSCTGHAILYCWKDDYQERLDVAARTRKAAEERLQAAVERLASRIRFQNRGQPLLVVNFQGWPVSGPVEIEGPAEGVAVRDGEGHQVPVQVADRSSTRLAFVAKDVPACGYKTYYLSAGPRRPDPAMLRGVGTVETDLYRAELADDGQVTLFDKRRGIRLGAAHGSLGELVWHDAPMPVHWELRGPLGPRRPWRPEAAESRRIAGPVYADLESDGSLGPHRASRRLRLWQGCRRIEYSVRVDAAEGCGAVAIGFPIGLGGQVSAGIPFGAEPRDQLEKEPFRGEYFVQGYPDLFYALRWTDLSDPQQGYTVVGPHGAPTGWFHRPENGLLECLLLRVRPMPRKPWDQVHPSMQGLGQHTWQCALVPHAGGWRESASYRDAMESHVPLVAHQPKSPRAGATASLPDACSLLEVGPAGVVLSSLRVAASDQAQSPEYEVRVYETLGRPAEAVLRFSSGVSEVRAVNFLGEPSAMPASPQRHGREIRFRLPPWKIATLRIRLAGA